jgi:N-acetylmuramoyl-L-alanine amidase
VISRILPLVIIIALLSAYWAVPAYADTQSSLPGAGKTVYIDPGHGGIESGAVHAGADGKVDLVERDVNLAIGLKLRALLEAAGFRVAMSRTTNGSPNTPAIDRNNDGRVTNRDEYQAVVDLANDSGADLMISIHNNGSTNKSVSGTETWFSPLRPFADRNLLIARLVQANLVASIRALGYNTVDRGIKDDSNYRVFNGRVYEIFVLGRADNTRFHPRAADMPAALGESLFLSNEADAAMLAQDSTQQAIAQGYYNAVIQYFQRLAEGTALEWPVPAVTPPDFTPQAAAEPAATATPPPTPAPAPLPLYTRPKYVAQ